MGDDSTQLIVVSWTQKRKGWPADQKSRSLHLTWPQNWPSSSV